MWPGYVTVVDELKGGLHVLCDVSHRVLRTDTVYDLLRELKRKVSVLFLICSYIIENYFIIFQNEKTVLTEATKALLGAIVLTRHNNKTYRIDDIDYTLTPRSTFPLSDGSNISFEEYYRTRYGITIKDLDQPMLSSIPRLKTKSEAGVDRVFKLVPELCNLTGLTDEMRNNYRIMKEVGSHTRLTPNQREEALQKFIRSVNDNPEAKSILSQWGLELSNESLQIKGRVLPSETLYFGGQHRELVGPNADWTRLDFVIDIKSLVISCKLIFHFTSEQPRLGRFSLPSTF